MNKIIPVFILTITLSSCSNTADNMSDYVFAPTFMIEYVDTENNNIMDKLGLENRSTVFDDNIFEIISLSDTEGNPVEYSEIVYGGIESCLAISVAKGFTYEDRKIEYTLQYKIPPILGKDSIETFKAVFCLKDVSFENICHNNKEMTVVDSKSYVPDKIWDIYDDVYCGESVAYLQGATIWFVLVAED